jgi:hypothetical protein
MLDIERILKQDRLIRAMTGLNSKAFNALLPSFTEAYEKSLIKPERKRKRAMGGGRKATLREMKDKLFYILLYCKCYPTFDLMSVLFNFDRSCAHQWVHRLLPILEVSLGDKKALPVRQLTSRKEFVEKFPFVKKVILDGTERPVQRPQDNEKQKEYYSGKKKRHTRKHITGSTDEKRVIYLSKGRGGKAHDKKQLDEENLGEYIPNDVAIEGDLGFKGLEQEYENVYLPHKKPKGKELSALQKIQNRELSRERVKCEHAHAGIKRYNCVTAVYRNRVPDFGDRLRLNSTGLWNFYLDAA